MLNNSIQLKRKTLLPSLALLLSLGNFTISNAHATTFNATSVTYSDQNGYSGTTTPGSFSNIEGGYGGIGTPGQISWGVATGAGAGTLGFEIAGYGSLDGQNCCTDTLTVYTNGTEVFSGTFNLGGGGNNVIFYNPTNAIWNAQSPSFYGGGTLDVSGLGVNLTSGTNTIQFVYSGGNQGIGDEGWGLKSASLVASSVPEAGEWAMILLSLPVLGWGVRRKQS
jgi:hypothetical protein